MKTTKHFGNYINNHNNAIIDAPVNFNEIYYNKDLSLEWSKEQKNIESNNSENEISDRLLCMLAMHEDVNYIIDFLNNSKKMNLQNIDNLLDYLFKRQEQKWCNAGSIWVFSILNKNHNLINSAMNDKRFDFKYKNSFNTSIWDYLISYGDSDLLIKAIDEGKFNSEEIRGDDGATIWHNLAEFGRYDVLIKAINDKRFDPDTTRDRIDATVWHYLAEYGYYDLLSKAIDEGKFDPKEVKDDSGATIWHYLAKYGHYSDLFEAIQAEKCDPMDIHDNDGAYIWHYLAKFGHYDELIKAIENGKFNPEEILDDHGATVWDYLAKFVNYDRLVMAIEDQGFDPNNIINNQHATVWHYLAKYGYYDELIKAINDKRFDPDTTRDCVGATVWHYLVLYGHYDELIKAINDKRFDPNQIKDNQDRSVWSYLAISGKQQYLYQAVKDKLFTYNEHDLCEKWFLCYLMSSDKNKNIYLSRLIIDFDIHPHFVKEASRSLIVTYAGNVTIAGVTFPLNSDIDKANITAVRASLSLAEASTEVVQRIIDNDRHISCLSYAVVFALYFKNVDKQLSRVIYGAILKTILRKKFKRFDDIDRDLLEVFSLKLDKHLCSFVVDELDVKVAAEVIKELILKKSIYDTESIEIINSMIVSLNLTRLFEDESNKVEIIAPLLSSFMQKFLVQETISQLEDLKDFESRFKIMWSDERWANILGANEITKVDVHSSSTSSASELMFSEKNRTYYGAEKRERDLTSLLSTLEQNEPSSKLSKPKI